MDPADGNAGWKLGANRYGQVAAWLALTLALLLLPTPPPVDAGLDASWELCLSYLFHHGAHFGDDVIFTFGPLGFVMYDIYAGSGFWLQLAFALIFSGMSAWILLASLKLMRWPYWIFALPVVLLLVAPDPDALGLLDITLVAILLLSREAEDRILIPASCCILGFFSLTKFTNFILAATVVGIVAGYHLLRKDRRRSVMLAGGFAIALCAWWLACRQPLPGIVSYVVNSMELSKGYSDAMFDYQRSPGWIGCTMAGLLVLYGVFEAVAARRDLRRLALIVIFGAATGLAWKHAFVRADPAHLLALYLWALAIVAFHPIFFPGKSWLVPRLVFLASIAFCVAWGVHRTLPGEFSHSAPLFLEKLRANSAAMANPAAFKRDLDSRYAAVVATSAAPRIAQAIGNDTVDVLGYEQSAAILNGLNYTPRPIFQSYGAYTPKLEELNFAFMAGHQAPQWILQQYATIDHRAPGLDDGLALRALLDRYTYQFEDAGYILWRRDAEKTLTSLPPAIREADAAINDVVPVNDLPENSSVWLEVDYSYNLAGKLKAELDKPPMVNLVVTVNDSAKSIKIYRFPRLLAREGVLLSPSLDRKYDFLKYAVGSGGPKVAAFAIQCGDQDAKYLQPTFHYRLRLLPPPLNLERNRMMADQIRALPMFATAPVGIKAARPITELRLDGRDALLVFAPSSIALSSPQAGGRLRGAFGLKTLGGDKVPKAEFQVVLRGGGGDRVLFDRRLNPAEVAADRGLQHLDLDLPAAAPGSVLLLNAIARAPGDTNANLTCWTGLEVDPLKN